VRNNGKLLVFFSSFYFLFLILNKHYKYKRNSFLFLFYFPFQRCFDHLRLKRYHNVLPCNTILCYLGLNFRNFFLNFFTNFPRLTNTVKGCKKVISFYSGKLSNVLFKRKKCLSSSSWLSYLSRF
jgi:hypothetical protein